MSRRALLIGGALAVAGLLVPAVLPMPLGLVWNASASAPMGLYAIRPMRHPVRGVFAVIRPPAALARFAAERRYLPLGVPLIKPVAATARHMVCRAGLDITIDNRPVGHALAHDSHGSPLPSWRGCQVLSASELFVMNAAVFDSFDGRYFGALATSTVLGRARSLWTWPSSSQPPRSRDHDPDR